MKLLISALAYLSIVGSSFGSALRSRNQRNLSDIVYTGYSGACRENSDGSGKGSDGDEYDLYKREDNSDVNYQWCKDKCDDKQSCSGFEYHSDGSGSQCEVWKKPIRGYEKKNDKAIDCMVKNDRKHRFRCDVGACRKYSDGTGKGNDGDEYKRVDDINFGDCEEMCSNDVGCTGFEYQFAGSSSPKQYCELWRAGIFSADEDVEHDIECCTKEYK